MFIPVLLNAQCSLLNPTFQARRPLPESPQRNETPWSSSTAWGGGTKDPSFKSHWGLSMKGKGGLLKEVVGRSCVPFPLLTGRIFYCYYCLVPLWVGGVPCSSNHAEALVGSWRPRLSQDATVPWITGKQSHRLYSLFDWDQRSRRYSAGFLWSPLTHVSALWLIWED